MKFKNVIRRAASIFKNMFRRPSKKTTNDKMVKADKSGNGKVNHYAAKSRKRKFKSVPKVRMYVVRGCYVRFSRRLDEQLRIARIRKMSLKNYAA